VSDPKAQHSSALIFAAMKGQVAVVKLLIPHSDPKAQKSEALCAAAGLEHREVVRLLGSVSDVPAAWNNLIKGFMGKGLSILAEEIPGMMGPVWVQKNAKRLKGYHQFREAINALQKKKITTSRRSASSTLDERPFYNGPDYAAPTKRKPPKAVDHDVPRPLDALRAELKADEEQPG
jgi:hypothetical protein